MKVSRTVWCGGKYYPNPIYGKDKCYLSQLYLNPLVKIISKKLGFEDDSDLSLDERISIVNTLMYININVINETYIKYLII